MKQADLDIINSLTAIKNQPGGGNATVPVNAPIQPAQAFVDNIAKFSFSDSLDLSNQGITSLDGTFITSWATDLMSLVGPPNINLSGNAITSVSVTDILTHLVAASSVTGGTLNISGGTNGVPSPLPVIVLDFNNIDMVDSTSYGTTSSGVVIYFEANLDTSLVDSTVNWAGTGQVTDSVNSVFTICLGTGTPPTKQQVIDKLVSSGGGHIADLGGLRLQASPPDFALEPFDFTGATGSSQTSGNTLIGSLRGHEWTVTTN